MLPPSLAALAAPACTGVVLFALAAAACADPGAPGWKFSGFGTVGVAHSDERRADFVATILQGDGAGHTARWSRHVDSKLGGQVDFTLNPRWSAVLQVVSQQRYDNSYQPRVEWANIKYQVTPELALRVGRIALPVFIAADYRKVGYAYPWVRTPIEVYGVLPLSSSDGADLSWQWNGESVRSTTQVLYGHTDVALYGGARLHGRGIAGLSHTVERGALSARASAMTARVSLSMYPELSDALRGFSAQGRDIAQRLAVADKRASMVSLGMNYDPGGWFVLGEAGYTQVDGFLGGTRSAYLSGGWRHGNLTPYAGYARVRGILPRGPKALSLDGLAPPYAAAGAALNAGLDMLLMRSVPSQSTLSAGLRWDCAPNLALKFQHERVTTYHGSRGLFINSTPDYQPGRTAHVTSAVLDFVF